MAVIIRLQNLSWSATAPDIRKFFNGLSIPNGGVHIVGGDEGDCFVAFSTDEDARKAMKLDGSKLANQKIKLLLSSKAEMEEIIAIARGEKPPPSSSSTTSLTSVQSRDASKEPLRHRSRSRSPRRTHSPPDRSRNSRRDTFRDGDRGSGARGPVAREAGRGTTSAANRTSGVSPDGRDPHRREIAKVDPLPLSGAGQHGERRLVQQPAGSGSSPGAQPKFYGATPQMTAKDRGLPADIAQQPPSKKAPLLPGVLPAAGPVSDRWLEDPQGASKGSAQQFSSSYGEAMFLGMPPGGGNSGWDNQVAVPITIDRQMHRKNSDGWPVGPPLQADPHPRAPAVGEPAFSRASSGAFQPQAGNSMPPAVSNKGRQGPGSRPPALLPTPDEPVRPQVEQEVEAVPLTQNSSSGELSAARRGLPRVAGAPQFDRAAPVSFDSFDRSGPFDRPTAAPFDRPVVSSYDHEHGVAASYDRVTAAPFDRSGPAFEPMEVRAFPPGPALPTEPAVRIFNLVQTATKKALRAFFAKNSVHPVDIKLVRRWHGDNVLGYALFSSATEAATVLTQLNGLVFEGGEPLSFEPCSRAEYDTVAEHGPAPAPRGSISQLCVTFTDLPPTATIKDLEELLAQTEYVVPSLYVEHDASGLCTGAGYVELGNVQDYETVLAMRKRVSIHGQIIRVRPINKEEMKARVVHHKDNLLSLNHDSMANAVMFHGGNDVVRPAPLDSDVFRRSPPIPATDRRHRFMGPASDGLGPLPPAAEGQHSLMMSQPVQMGPDRGIVLHLTDLPHECNVGRLMDFLQPAQIDPNYVRVLSFPDGSCSGEAFVKVFHPQDTDTVLQRDRMLWAGRPVRVWKASEKVMEDVVASFESQFAEYDGGRRARAEPHLDHPRWRPRYDGHDGLPAL